MQAGVSYKAHLIMIHLICPLMLFNSIAGFQGLSVAVFICFEGGEVFL